MVAGKNDVPHVERRDSLSVHAIDVHPTANGKRREDRNLVSRIDAIDIERGSASAKPAALAQLSAPTKMSFSSRHARENVVRRSVENSVDPLYTIGGEPLVNPGMTGIPPPTAASEYTNASARAAVVETPARYYRQQRLVRRGDMLARIQRREHDRARRLIASNELNNDIDVGIGHNRAPIIGDPRLGRKVWRYDHPDFVAPHVTRTSAPMRRSMSARFFWRILRTPAPTVPKPMRPTRTVGFMPPSYRP